jgi:membrane protease YdiL (CAAX protease family)
LGCLIVIGVLARLFRRRPVLSRVPLSFCVAILVGLVCLPLVVAWHFQRPVGRTLLTFAWLIVGAGIGEEVFYRGYIQSRINETFGRPYRLGGIQFGMGLLVSTALFGFLHTLNTVDYFHGRFTFAWGFGVAALGTGLIFGCLREGAGSIVAPAVAHSILDVLARIPTLIS